MSQKFYHLNTYLAVPSLRLLAARYDLSAAWFIDPYFQQYMGFFGTFDWIKSELPKLANWNPDHYQINTHQMLMIRLHGWADWARRNIRGGASMIEAEFDWLDVALDKFDEYQKRMVIRDNAQWSLGFYLDPMFEEEYERYATPVKDTLGMESVEEIKLLETPNRDFMQELFGVVYENR